MAQAHPLRRRDRGGRLDEDYMADNAYGYYDDPRRPSPRGRDVSPPPRERTRRSRRAASPEMYNPQPRYESPPRRSRSTRDPPPRYGADPSPRRYHSPPPAYASEGSRRGRGVPPARQTFPADDYGRGDPYGAAYAPDPRSNRGGRYDDPDPRGGGRRSRYASPSPERKPRGGGRGAPPMAYEDASPPRRHRSSAGRAGGYGAYGARAASPPARGRPPPATAGRPHAAAAAKPARRNSMPATGKAAKAGWWTNPLIQAAGRTALTAGAQAAMSSRKDQGPWIGPKGAKVAQAALMGGIMDGFMGKGGGGGGGDDRHAPPPKSSMKSDLMREGMAAAMGRFGNKR